ncbi:MAG: hypothetical protein JXO22_03305 [Phycisphaerae bacterium]|nr:hypothetical protein [Phycisphaerae bacterium]
MRFKWKNGRGEQARQGVDVRGMTPMGLTGVFWFGPVLMGVMLIAVGVLIVLLPQLLAYAVAGLLMVAGMALVGMGWRMRRQFTYRRVDTTQWQVMDPFDEQ